MMTYEETDLRYYIADSTMPNAGKGLFAKEFLKKGDWLEISGVLVMNGSVADECTEYAKRYKFAGSPKKNAKIVPMGYAGIVNHTDDPHKQNAWIEYVPGLQKRSPHSGQMVYRFIRDIHPGEEILGNYGDSVAKEIRKLNESADAVNERRSAWEAFVSLNLYDLERLHKLLDG